MVTVEGSKRTTTPSGWLTSIAQTRLRESGYEELKNLHCDEYDGVLRLRGTVTSPQLLQTALALLAAIPSSRGIDNRVVVAIPSRWHRAVH